MRTEADESIDESKMDLDQPTTQPEAGQDDGESWLEFETIAITRAEWEALGTQFAKSKHPDEKALHKILSTDIVPRVLEDIAEAEKAAALEAALAARKRSSRIAMKESEREEREREVDLDCDQVCGIDSARKNDRGGLIGWVLFRFPSTGFY